jgi:2-oxoisovalerate dehydrogenase E2 component (dihydrolipoyl transacylase)
VQGDMVDEFAPVCEVQSDKASVVITSRYKGQVSQIRFNPGDVVKVGETLLELMLEGSAQGESNETPNPNSAKPSIAEPEARLKDDAHGSESTQSPVLAAPAARALAKEYGVDLTDIVGTGSHGRVTKGDIMNYVSLRENTQDDILDVCFFILDVCFFLLTECFLYPLFVL